MEQIYRSDGVVVAVVHRGHLYNVDGDWIGFLQNADVFGAGGEYLGYLSDDRRLLRPRRTPRRERVRPPRPFPHRLRDIPEYFPMAPLLKQLPFSIIDVFEEYPDQFRYVSETRPDMA